jgi:hypothetical protein
MIRQAPVGGTSDSMAIEIFGTDSYGTDLACLCDYGYGEEAIDGMSFLELLGTISDTERKLTPKQKAAMLMRKLCHCDLSQNSPDGNVVNSNVTWREVLEALKACVAINRLQEKNCSFVKSNGYHEIGEERAYSEKMSGGRFCKTAPYLVIYEVQIGNMPTLVIAYRGTFYMDDKAAVDDSKLFFDKNDKEVHNGVYTRFTKIEKLLNEDTQYQRSIGKCNDILVVGQSLGGGLASMKAFDLKESQKEKNIKLVTFSDLPVFSGHSASYAERTLGKQNIVRFNRDGDMPIVGTEFKNALKSILSSQNTSYKSFGNTFYFETNTNYSNIKQIASVLFRNHNIIAIAADVLSVAFSIVHCNSIKTDKNSMFIDIGKGFFDLFKTWISE